MSDAQATQKQYPLLDILRFAAALLVATHHLIGTNTKDDFWRHFLPTGFEARPYYSHVNETWFIGYVGVEIFFSISGYIISVSAMNSRSGPDFFKKRLLRILPALWICTVLATLLYVTYDVLPMAEIVTRFLRSMLLMPFGPYIDGVLWTIIVEMAFYAAVCIFIGFVAREKIALLGYALIGASAIYWTVVTLFPSLETQLVMQIARRTLLEHGAFFGVGILLSVWSRRTYRNWSVVFLVIAAIPTYLQIRASVQHVYVDLGDFGATLDVWKPYLFWLLSAVLLYISTVLADAGYFRGNYAGVRKIGLMTYPLYLIHYTVGHFFYAMLVRFFDFAPFVNSLTAIVLVVALSFFIAQYPEKYLRRLLQGPFDALFSRFSNILVLPSRYRKTV